jgi:solute carrier family 25 folate transporter 32
VYSAFLTNPLWVIKTRMFTTRRGTPGAYKGVLGESGSITRKVLLCRTDGMIRISKEEGLRGLYKGTTLALFGISNGAIQFMTYEHLKRWGKDRKRRLRGDSEQVGEVDLEQLVSLRGLRH